LFFFLNGAVFVGVLCLIVRGVCLNTVYIQLVRVVLFIWLPAGRPTGSQLTT
jgi:hypothetical protein